MNRIHPAAAPRNDGSRTLVLRPEEHEAGPSSPPTAGVLRLRGATADPATRQRRVVWTQDTVDNEHLGRKSSKICCIYHKPKAYDESSDESSSGSSSSESDSDSEASDSSSSPPSDGPTMSQAMKDKRAAKGKERSKAPRHQHDHGADELCSHEGSGARPSAPKPRKGKRRVKPSRNGTMVITKTEEEEEEGKDEDGDAGGAPDSSDDDDDDEAERRKRNAYERGVM